MKITLMCNVSDRNKVGKTLQTIAQWDGYLRDSTSMEDPVIEVSAGSNINLAQCNYLYIPSFGRYYYVQDITATYKDMWALSCHVDVLETYKDYIKALNALVERREDGSPYVPDTAVSVYSNPYIQTAKFPTGFPSPEYLLTVIGL